MSLFFNLVKLYRNKKSEVVENTMKSDLINFSKKTSNDLSKTNSRFLSDMIFCILKFGSMLLVG